MQLVNEQIEILQLIFNSENHCISGNDISILKIDFPDLNDDLKTFIKYDLVEYDAIEDTYYLAFEGFEILKKRDQPVISYKSDVDQYNEIIKNHGGMKQFQKTTLLSLLMIGITGAMFIYFNPESFYKPKKQFPFNLNEQTTKELMEQVREIADSIRDTSNLMYYNQTEPGE